MKKEIVELMVASGMLTPEQGEYIINAKSERVIKGHLYTYTDAQLAVYFAHGMIERIGADIELTNVGIDLQNAENRLADFLIKEQSPKQKFDITTKMPGNFNPCAYPELV